MALINCKLITDISDSDSRDYMIVSVPGDRGPERHVVACASSCATVSVTVSVSAHHTSSHTITLSVVLLYNIINSPAEFALA